MVGLQLISYVRGLQVFAKSDMGSQPKRPRLCRVLNADSLEMRTCLSTMAPSIAGEHLKPASLLAHDSALVEKSNHLTLVLDSTRAAARIKANKLLATVYVQPGAKLTTTLGKTAKKPIGSINKALSLVRPGGTIILAPGVYTENVKVSQKTGITIVGAPGGASILSPPSGDAMNISASTNITVDNVWVRASQGRGIVIMGASVDLNTIQTAGTRGDGVVVTGYGGRASTLDAVSSHFDAVQLGDGLDLQTGATATINACSFNGVGTSPNASQTSNGLVMSGNAIANIANSQFIGNTNSGLVALNSSQVTAMNSTFSSNLKGDGALIIGATVATLQNDTFSSNGQTFGPTTGLNGLEFTNGFAGTAYVTNDSFLSNTGNGLYMGSSGGTIQVLNNVFTNNFVGITMDSTAGGNLNASILENTIGDSPSNVQNSVGILAVGQNVTATIGGNGSLANTFSNYVDGTFIYITDGDGNTHTSGFPNLTILTNGYYSNGQPVSPSDAIHNG